MKRTAGGKIRVEMVPVGDLPAFAAAELERAGGEGLIPIPPVRARAQSRNPYAEPDDPGLFAVYSGQQCVGYYGVLPGLLRIGAELSRVYWGSTSYILPEFRRTAATLIMARIIKKAVPESAYANVSPEGVKVLKYMGVRPLGRLPYRIVNLRRMPPKVRRQLLLFGARKRLREITTREAEEIDPADFFRPAAEDDGVEFYRGPEAINWMLRHKWVAIGSGGRRRLNYQFSHHRDYFRHIAVKVYSVRGNDYKGFAVILVSSSGGRTVLKVLDDSFASPFDRRYILPIALSYAERHRADYIQFSDELTRFLSRGSPLRLFARPKERLYLAHSAGPDSPVARAFGGIRLKFCDGDTAFT